MNRHTDTHTDGRFDIGGGGGLPIQYYPNSSRLVFSEGVIRIQRETATNRATPFILLVVLSPVYCL